MDWTRRSAGSASAWQIPHLVFVILAVAGIMVVALADAGCGHATSASNIAASRPSGNGESGCPTEGVGGDTLPPPCAAQAGSPTGGTTGTPGPAPQPAPSNSGVALPAPSSNQGISGPVTPAGTPTAPPSPGAGIQAPIIPTESRGPVALQVTGISPPSGTAAGGDTVTIYGGGFTDATAVYFGGVSATMTVNTDTEITATSPPGTGTVDVTVVTPAGTSAPTSTDQFSYQG